MRKHSFVWVGLGVVIFVFLVFGLMNHGGGRDGEETELTVFCAAGLQKPVTVIARRYEEETGVKLRLQFGGSGALESQLRVAGGDLFLPADDHYLSSLEGDGLLESVSPVTVLTAGLVVAAGNPKGFDSVADLSKDGVTISLAERSASIGKFAREVLQEEGMMASIDRNVVVTKPTVTGVVSDVAIGAADVTIGWDVVASNFRGVEWIGVPEFEKREKRVAIGVLKEGQVVEATEFVRYLRGDAGRRVFEEMGYRVDGE